VWGNICMAKPGVSSIPHDRRISMERLLNGKGYSYTTIKQVALHVGLPEDVVKRHLLALQRKKEILETSPFYKK